MALQKLKRVSLTGILHWVGQNTFSRADWFASCLAMLPMKCSLKIKLPHYICIVWYAWSAVLWNRLVRVAIHRRAKSNQLDIATEILLSWRECQSNYQRLLLKNERADEACTHIHTHTSLLDYTIIQHSAHILGYSWRVLIQSQNKGNVSLILIYRFPSDPFVHQIHPLESPVVAWVQAALVASIERKHTPFPEGQIQKVSFQDIFWDLWNSSCWAHFVIPLGGK